MNILTPYQPLYNLAFCCSIFNPDPGGARDGATMASVPATLLANDSSTSSSSTVKPCPLRAPLVVTVVGLPCRGKSLAAHKVARHLSWRGESAKGEFLARRYRKSRIQPFRKRLNGIVQHRKNWIPRRFFST